MGSEGASGRAGVWWARCLVSGVATIALLYSAHSMTYAADDSSAASTHTKLQWQPYRPSDRAANVEAPAIKVEAKASREEPKRKSTVRLAAVDESDAAPVLANPFEDSRSSNNAHRQAIAVEEVDSLPAPARVISPSHVDSRTVTEAPAELDTSASSVGDGHAQQSVKVYQGAMQPQSGADTFQPAQPAPMPNFDSSPQRAPQSPEEDCRVAYERVKKISVDKIDLDIKVAGRVGTDVPFECTLTTDRFNPRSWQPLTYTWKASALCHKPLFFEQEALERYGHSAGWGCEELLAGAHFFGDVALLPYHFGVEGPCECIYDLGVYRPGDCAPWIVDGFPVSLRGAATAAVGYGAVIALFP
jgi:hypothetical protein